MEFVYRRIAGIECVTPGFRKVRIAPTVMERLDCVKAEYESVNGKIVSAYEAKDGKTYYNIELADTMEAEMVLLDRKPFVVQGGKYKYVVRREHESHI